MAASAACSSSETPKTAVVDVTTLIKESDNGQWWEIFQELTLDECIEEIKGNSLLQP